MDRPARVYLLDITYPPGAHTPGWHPPGWAPDRPGDRFAWPKFSPMCLSLVTAKRRAAELEAYGAYVTVHPSHPVTWPFSPTDATEGAALADQCAVLRARIDQMERDAEHLRVQLEGERARAARYAERLGLPTYTPT